MNEFVYLHSLPPPREIVLTNKLGRPQFGLSSPFCLKFCVDAAQFLLFLLLLPDRKDSQHSHIRLSPCVLTYAHSKLVLQPWLHFKNKSVVYRKVQHMKTVSCVWSVPSSRSELSITKVGFVYEPEKSPIYFSLKCFALYPQHPNFASHVVDIQETFLVWEFIFKIFVECPLCTEHSFRFWKYKGSKTRPCSSRSICFTIKFPYCICKQRHVVKRK